MSVLQVRPPLPLGEALLRKNEFSRFLPPENTLGGALHLSLSSLIPLHNPPPAWGDLERAITREDVRPPQPHLEPVPRSTHIRLFSYSIPSFPLSVRSSQWPSSPPDTRPDAFLKDRLCKLFSVRSSFLSSCPCRARFFLPHREIVCVAGRDFCRVRLSLLRLRCAFFPRSSSVFSGLFFFFPSVFPVTKILLPFRGGGRLDRRGGVPFNASQSNLFS